MSIKKKSRKFYEISKLDARIGALENEYSGVN